VGVRAKRGEGEGAARRIEQDLTLYRVPDDLAELCAILLGVLGLSGDGQGSDTTPPSEISAPKSAE
jgi:hypothetical protein